jgi:transposase-like protein
MAATKALLESAKMVTGIIPGRVITDGHDSYPRAIRTTLGACVRQRDGQYLNNRLEQDHRGVKDRYGPRLNSNKIFAIRVNRKLLPRGAQIQMLQNVVEG